MYYFKKLVKDWQGLFNGFCMRKVLKKAWFFAEESILVNNEDKQRYIFELFQQEKEDLMRSLHKSFNNSDEFLGFLTIFFETVYFLIDFLGTEFKDDGSGLLFDCYNYFSYAIKAMMFLQDLFKKEAHKTLESLTPTLSRLNTKDYSLEKHLSRKFSKQYEKINCKNMEECFKYLYYKMSAVIAQFMKEKPENLNKIYVSYIKNSPSPLALSSEIKFSFLKFLSINQAKKSPKIPSHNFNLDDPDNVLSICIKRDQIWQSTLDHLLFFEPWELALKHIKITFENEVGSDFGGLTREWLALLNKEIFNPDYGLFQLSANKTSYQPSSLSHCVPDHLIQFRMLGRLIAKTLIEQSNFEVHFVKSFLKHILSKICFIYFLVIFWDKRKNSVHRGP